MVAYFMSPSGSDSNTGTSIGSPFQHFAKVTSVMPTATECTLNLADGTYADGLDLVHYRMLSVYGNQTDATKVIVTGGSRGVPFTIEDDAIFTIDGATLAGPGVGIKSRQNAIVDATNIRVVGGNGAIPFCASEDSRQNILGPIWFDGNMIGGFAFNADGKSTLTIGGIIVISTPLTTTALIRAVQQSLVLTDGAIFQNPSYFYGAQWIINNSEITLPTAGTLPGFASSNVAHKATINGV